MKKDVVELKEKKNFSEDIFKSKEISDEWALRRILARELLYRFHTATAASCGKVSWVRAGDWEYKRGRKKLNFRESSFRE